MATAQKARVRKRCSRCGIVREVWARQRKCRQRRFGRGSYACWGDLQPVRPLAGLAGAVAQAGREALAEAVSQMPFDTGALRASFAADGSLDHTKPARRRPQDVAAAKLAKAEALVAKKIAEIATLAVSLKKWQRRTTQLSKLAAQTDADIAAARQRRAESATRRKAAGIRRGIRLEKENS